MKGILSTLLVIQLILITLLTFSFVENQRLSFNYKNQYLLINSFKLRTTIDDIRDDIYYLKSINASNYTINKYFEYVNSTFNNIFLYKLNLSKDKIEITTPFLEMKKEAKI